MTFIKASGLALLLGASVFGQFSNGISQSVSRSVAVPPDEAVFSVSVTAPLDTTQERVLEVLQKTGITSKDLTGFGVAPNYYPDSSVDSVYDFGMIVPADRM